MGCGCSSSAPTDTKEADTSCCGGGSSSGTNGGGFCGCGMKKYALTIVRIVLGIIFLMHGGQKVLGWFGGAGLAGTVSGMTQMGLPAILVYIVAFTEFLGGAALILGLLSRLAAFGIMCVMVGAVVTVHLKNGFFINWYMTPNVGHGFEYNLALIAMSLGVIIGGPGGCALDNLWCKKSCCS